jgi:pimeloyl-ACP methyl ester carboxylesterase
MHYAAAIRSKEMNKGKNKSVLETAVTLVLVAVFTLIVAPAVAGAAGDGAVQTTETFDAHATGFKYFFKDGDMDFHFGNLILGSATSGGAEIGEAFYAASQIKDGDAASWQKEWAELAERVEARGKKSLAAGHKVSARDQFLRAAYYYRFSVISMLPDNPQLKARGLKVRSLMRKAGTFFDPPLEYFEIPFEDTVLPGYFRKAGNTSAPTLLMIGGGETFAEDLVFYIDHQAFVRGYNFVTVDLPGQGLMPAEGKIFRTDTNVPMKAVVDYVLDLPGVDPAHLAAYGISGGGLFVPQAAMHDRRIKAIAMSAAVVDGHALFATMPAALATEKEIDSWSTFHGDVVKSICWRYGVPMDKPLKLIDANKGNTFDPSKIAVPALIIVGEGEYKSKEVQQQQKIAMDNFANANKKLVVTPSNEGATNHCIFENRSLVGQVLFDWLDEIFK